MANHVSHAALPFPVKGARYTIAVPYLDADGDPTDPTSPDTERSIDGGAFADCTEEVTTVSGSNGMGYLTLTGDEMNCSLLEIAAKVASGPKATLLAISPRVLPIIATGTAQAGASGTITLAAGASAVDDFYVGCIVRTTGGTAGGGGSGKQNNQARVITDYVGSTKVASVEPNWETNPSSDTTYDILLTDLATNAMMANVMAWIGKALATPATDGYPVATLKVGTGTGEVNLSSGKVPATLAAADVSGNPSVNVTQISGDSVAADNLESYCDGTTPIPSNTTHWTGTALSTPSDAGWNGH